MSETRDKVPPPSDQDLPDRNTARDKTVLKFGGSTVWPSGEIEDSAAAADQAAGPTEQDTGSEAVAGAMRPEGSTVVASEVPGKKAPAEDPELDAAAIWSDATQSHTASDEPAEEVIADTAGMSENTGKAQQETPQDEAPAPTGELSSEPMTEAQNDAPEERDKDEVKAEPDNLVEPAANETVSNVQEEAQEEPAPPVEQRIEVPVQQQYASLLAALSERIEKHPGGHDLLAVLRMLEGQTAPGAAPSGISPRKKGQPAPPRIGKSRRLMEDIVRFGQDPSSEFAPSTIERATRDSTGGLVLLERFLGLLGPHGALPSAYTDEAIMRGLRGDESFPRFLDVFNNRFIQLFFRAWADARPIVQHDRPDDDRFLTYLGSAIGIGSPIYRNLDRIDDRLKLLYAGLTSPKNKSAARLKALITGVFGVKVEIDQCVGTWLHLDKDDQLNLGGYGPGGPGRLGVDTIVGAKVFSVSDKIRIRIFTRSLEEYRKFLPPTRTKPNLWTEKLFDLIDFYLGLEVEYEIELALPKRCASSVRMDATSSATLGHIGWLKPAASAGAEAAEGGEEEMLTDTRFRPVRRHTAVYQ